MPLGGPGRYGAINLARPGSLEVIMSGESDTVLLLGCAAGRSSEATILRQDMAAKAFGAGGLGMSGPGSVVAGHLVCRESLLRIVSVAATALCQPEAMLDRKSVV